MFELVTRKRPVKYRYEWKMYLHNYLHIHMTQLCRHKAIIKVGMTKKSFNNNGFIGKSDKKP